MTGLMAQSDWRAFT